MKDLYEDLKALCINFLELNVAFWKAVWDDFKDIYNAFKENLGN